MTSNTSDPTRPAHSRFGGSIASRWMNCAGSVTLCESVPKRASSGYADEGTWAHALAAYCLEHGHTDASAFHKCSLPMGVEVPRQYSGEICGKELCDAVDVYLAAVFEELDLTADAELFVEQDFTLDIPTAEPGEVFGRNDAMVWHPSIGRLRVFDYKHGAGVEVDAEDSDQLKFYAAGAIGEHPEWKVEELILTIVQPRPFAVVSGKAEAVKDWPIPLVDLMLFVDEATDAIGAAKSPDGMGHDFKAGGWCRWCDAAAVCPAQERQALEEAGLAFQDVTQISVDVLPEPKTLDMDRLERVVAASSLLAAWAGQCQAYLEGLVLSGHPAKGFKAVEKIGRRKYVNSDEEIIGFLDMVMGIPEDVSTRTTLQTLTDMKKILKQYGATKEQLDDFELRFTVKESSGLTMAPISDRRPAVTPAAAAFEGVDLTV